MKEYLQKVMDRKDLTQTEASDAFDLIMSGDATSAQIAGLIIALRMKGECDKVMKLRFDVGTVEPDSSRMYFQFGLKMPYAEARIVNVSLHWNDEVISTNSYDLDMVDEGESTRGKTLYDRVGKWAMA